MKRAIHLIFAMLLYSQGLAQTTSVKDSVDALIDWNDPRSLTPERFKEVAEALPRKSSEKAFSSSLNPNGGGIYTIGNIGGRRSSGGKMSLFDGAIKVGWVGAVFASNKVTKIFFHLGDLDGSRSKKASLEDVAKLKSEIAKHTRDSSPKPCQYSNGGGHPPSPGIEWTGSSYKVQMFEIQNFDSRSSGRTVVTNTGVYVVTIVLRSA